MFKVTVTSTFDLLTPKSIGSIYGSKPFMIPRMVNLAEISMKFISGQDFTSTEKCPFAVFKNEQ